MPLPTPANIDRDQAAWVSWCMSIDQMKREFPNNDQRLAVCHSQFRNRNKRPTEQRAIATTIVKKIEEGYSVSAAVVIAENLA